MLLIKLLRKIIINEKYINDQYLIIKYMKNSIY